MSALIWRSLFLLLAVIYVDAAKIPTGSLSAGTAENQHSFPVFKVVESVIKPNTNFSGTFHSEYSVHFEGDFELNPDDQRLALSWEEAWPATGERIDQFIRLDDTELSSQSLPEEDAENARAHGKNRQKRKIFYADRRYLINVFKYGHRFPIVSVVKLSTGCTGTLISPKHVLTAAHCVHDQSDYVEGYSTLKVGLLPNLRVSQKFQWIRVNKTFLPKGWLMGSPTIASRFDYALLELDQTHRKPFFELAKSDGFTEAIIHFTAYEDDKPVNTLWFRSCKVKTTDAHVLYHYCDAMPGSSGAGVYTWTKFGGEWNRRLIGVFSGYRWKNGRDYNAAIRLNTLKYTQICGWMGKYAARSCKEMRRSPST